MESLSERVDVLKSCQEAAIVRFEVCVHVLCCVVYALHTSTLSHQLALVFAFSPLIYI